MAAINSICRPNISQMFFSSGTMPTSTSQGLNSNLGFNSHQNLSRNLSIGGRIQFSSHANHSRNLSSWGQSLMRKITSSTEAEAEAGISGLDKSMKTLELQLQGLEEHLQALKHSKLAPTVMLKSIEPQQSTMKTLELQLQELEEHLQVLTHWNLVPTVMLNNIGPQQSTMNSLNLQLQGLGEHLQALELGKLGKEDMQSENQLAAMKRAEFICGFVVATLLAQQKKRSYCRSCRNKGY